MTLQLPFFFSNYNILLFRRIDVNYSFRRIDVNLIAILFDDTKISIFLFFRNICEIEGDVPNVLFEKYK